MSKKRSKAPFLFQSLKGKKIKFSRAEQVVIDGLKPLSGGEWEGAIKGTSTVRRMDRDAVRIKIKDKLIKIQDRYCIYCGLHEDYCGTLEREHIAPKGTTSYPHFMFEPENLCLACHHCNFDLKGEVDTISKPSSVYKNNKFTIVHPYLNDFDSHITFVVKNGNAIIQRKPGSRKGKRTIELFELDSPANTDKRSGLLIKNEWTFKDKYDTMLEAALKRKYIRT